MAHVFARVSGFGWTILPLYPYRLARVDGDPRAVRVTREGERPTEAVVHLEPGAPRVDLAEGTDNEADVCDLLPSSVAGDLRVETSVYSVAWPLGVDIVASEPGVQHPFDFLRSDGCLVYVQGPFAAVRLPKVEALCAPGQRIVHQGTHANGAFLELEYEHEGEHYWQRYATVNWSDADASILIVSAQSPLAQAPFTRTAAATVVESLAPFTK